MKNTYTIKFVLTLGIICFILAFANAQSKGVLIGGGTLDSKAIFQLEASDRGFLPPRMSAGERDANLPSPPAGMTIYNETSKMIETWDGTRWVGAGLFSGSYSGTTLDYVFNTNNTMVSLLGPDNNGTIAGLKIGTSASNFILIDNNEIDSNNGIPLILNGNSNLDVTLGSSSSTATNTFYGSLTNISSNTRITGDDNNGSTAALRISAGSQNMYIDGNEIDSDGELYLNNNSNEDIRLGSSSSNAVTRIYGKSMTASLDGAALVVDGGMYFDGDDIDSDGTLYLNDYSDAAVNTGGSLSVGDNLSVSGDITRAYFRATTGGKHLNMTNVTGNATGETGFVPETDGTCYLGVPAKRWRRIYTDDIVETSDKRKKENFRNIASPLETVIKMKGWIYDWKKEHVNSDKKYYQNQLGFIAQDLEKVVPALVEYDKESDSYAVNYIKAIPLLVEAIKEQEDKIKTQQAEIDALKAQQNQVTAMMQQLEARLNQLDNTSVEKETETTEK